MSVPDLSTFDLQATLARLFVYPIKSCAGIELRESPLWEAGLDLDRAWMAVDESGEFLSQRRYPRMALIRPQLRTEEVVLRAPGMLALHLAIDRVEAPVEVRIWKDTVRAFDMGDLAAQWFSDFLSEPGAPVQARLVRFDPDCKRVSDPAWTGGEEALNQFNDGYPLLALSEASMAAFNERLVADGHAAVGIERFRPNLVLAGIEAHDEDRASRLVLAGDEGPIELVPCKPCMRCPIPEIDPATAARNPEVGEALRGLGADPRRNGAISFGMNVFVRHGVGQMLRAGQAVGVELRFG